MNITPNCVKKHTSLSFLALALAAQTQAGTVGFWRFDESSAATGAAITNAENAASPGTLDAAPNGGAPLYSDDVPFPEIFDPVANQTYTNSFSFDASGGDARFLTPNDASLDSSFTVEFFVKMTGEPANYESIFDRFEFSDLVWKIDFDHGANQAYGRLRTRWDTPAGAPDGVAEQNVDENWNFTLGPQANASGPKVFIDTGAKDATGANVGPQNTGNANDYIYNAASANPNETDVALQGDGINDVDEWHHVAMSFNETTGEIKFYFDYALAQTRTLADTEADGYTHPAAGLRFGKLAPTGFGLLLDEVRYSDEILTASDFLREPASGTSNTIAHWRMDDDGAAAGNDISQVANDASVLHSAITAAGTPKYSADVPAPNILDPITNTTYPNNFSLDASAPNSRLNAPTDASFDTSFSLEFFIKLTGEPGGYHAFIRRSQANDLRWQLDFDNANTGAFGRLRTRFDTPGPLGPDGANEAGVDENINFVLGPVGGANIPDAQRLWIDTDLGDGMASSYNDPADWFLDGDGINDIDAWHHAAITFDDQTGTINFYYDYELLQSRTLSDNNGDGYTHPNGPIEFGKLSSEGYSLFYDEIRYSGEVLLPFQFLQAVNTPATDLEITELVYNATIPGTTVTWNTVSGRLYSLDYSTDLENWFEILEEEPADGDTMSYTDNNTPGTEPKLFYRVREIN